jgi:hypothetical protein
MVEIDYNKVFLKALAEIRRHQIIATKANPQTEDVFPNAFVHAIIHSVCPVFDEQVGFTDGQASLLYTFPFHETYDVPHDLVKEIAELLDGKWLRNCYAL